ncbi:PEP-CTERM sorting domain-containing protein [Thioalkalivibrio sp. AKL17]|uniref:PEP-CTERM sorting domain-containing protein n=1 Tax=Thioalkalivibrio sp. AKL17 TaxID=1158160 RepID=UPI0003739EEB|nr:PEP-CTERM sorting domain-containing protein [Thioalkalivibrio sp. AKL17]
MNYKNLLLTTALGMAMTSPALAGSFVIDVDQDFSGNSSTQTGEIDTLGTSNTLASSFYLGDPNTAGTQFVDTNLESSMDGFGFSEGNFTAIDGESSVSLKYPDDVADKNVVNLNFVSGVGGTQANNGFSSDEWFYDDTGWGLTFDYEIQGEVYETDNGDLSIRYTDGFFDTYFEDGASGDRTKVMRMDVEGSVIQAANLDIMGKVSFDDEWADNEFVRNFFIDHESGESFYDIASEEGGAGIPISWRLDTNVDPPIPTADQLVELESGALVRQTQLNSTVRYEVPEPGMLILLGTGLLFLGFIAIRGRRQTNDNNLRAQVPQV